MDSQLQEISEEMRRVTGTKRRKNRFSLMTGVVVSVDESECSAVVQLTTDADGKPTEGVTINVVLENTTGMYGVPADNAFCIVAEIDGSGKWEVIKASKYKKIVAKLTDGTTLELAGDGTMKMALPSGAEVSTDAAGKFVIKNSGADLGAVLKGLVQHLLSLTVATALGPSGPPINLADFTTDLAKLNLIF